MYRRLKNAFSIDGLPSLSHLSTERGTFLKAVSHDGIKGDPSNLADYPTQPGRFWGGALLTEHDEGYAEAQRQSELLSSSPALLLPTDSQLPVDAFEPRKQAIGRQHLHDDISTGFVKHAALFSVGVLTGIAIGHFLSKK